VRSPVTLDDAPRPAPDPAGVEAKPYHPSALFRRLLNQPGRQPSRAGMGWVRVPLTRPAMAPVAPGLGTVCGAAVVVGVLSGWLELVVRVAPVRVLHHVARTSVMISQHAAWMLPVAAVLVIVPTAAVLVSPILAWASWRRRHGDASRAVSWAWGWAGMVLGLL